MMIPGATQSPMIGNDHRSPVNPAPAFADEVAAARGSSQGLAANTPANHDTSTLDELNYPAMRDRFEREFIIKALKAYKGRINQTAEATQMTKVTLLRKLEKYGIDAKDYFKL